MMDTSVFDNMLSFSLGAAMVASPVGSESSVFPAVVPMALYRKEAREDLRKYVHRRIDEIDPTLLLRYSYVPFCIAEGAWDYADACIDCAILMRLTPAKRVSRAIRELRRSYQKKREQCPYAKYTHAQCEAGELDNYLGIEEIDHTLFYQMRLGIRQDIRNQCPDLIEEYIQLLTCVYACRTILRALFVYTARWSEEMRKYLEIDVIGDILPPELHALYKIIEEFAGDKKITLTSADEFVNVFVNKLSTVSFTDLD